MKKLFFLNKSSTKLMESRKNSRSRKILESSRLQQNSLMQSSIRNVQINPKFILAMVYSKSDVDELLLFKESNTILIKNSKS